MDCSVNRLEIVAGDHQLITQDGPKGCPLSPLMGALILKSLGKVVNEKVPYVRYMDDWMILTKMRGQLRRMVIKMRNIIL